MHSQWGSLQEFLAMGGYGFYVWGSYLVAAFAIAAEIVLVRGRLRRASSQARAIVQRKATGV